jgi:small subunit ribosomal protein S8
MYAGIKNGYSAKKIKISQPRNKLCAKMLNIFYKEGFIKNYRVDPSNSKNFVIFLKYINGTPIITQLDAVSTPSKKVYINARDLWKLHNGINVLIMSTTKGFLTDRECKELHLGGEIFCKIK